jgi:DNA-binding NtrC family response regulator
MRKVLDMARRAAGIGSTVLITGENGVGKEWLARLIHEASSRAQRPLVPVNCCALPESLFESELFGHSRGAFTGADRERIGLADGRFRGDLYYRLHVLELHTPPLRERLEDLRELAENLLLVIAGRLQRAITGYTAAALDVMARYPSPGNIRELENVIERACAFAAGTQIDVDDLPDEVHKVGRLALAPERIRPLRDVEREYILEVLQQNGGNNSRTAAQLRIDEKTLRRKLKSYAAA